MINFLLFINLRFNMESTRVAPHDSNITYIYAEFNLDADERNHLSETVKNYAEPGSFKYFLFRLKNVLKRVFFQQSDWQKAQTSLEKNLAYSVLQKHLGASITKMDEAQRKGKIKKLTEFVLRLLVTTSNMGTDKSIKFYIPQAVYQSNLFNSLFPEGKISDSSMNRVIASGLYEDVRKSHEEAIQTVIDRMKPLKKKLVSIANKKDNPGTVFRSAYELVKKYTNEAAKDIDKISLFELCDTHKEMLELIKENNIAV